ncbi:MAG: hypothetical protein SO072_09260 [Dysosmobacter sp.]|nr:hypothetical protein [Dysosmobacter sp.]
MLMFSGRSCRFLFTISQRNRFVIHWGKTAGEGCLVTPGTRRTSAAAGGKEFFGKEIFCKNDLKQEKTGKYPVLLLLGNHESMLQQLK